MNRARTLAVIVALAALAVAPGASANLVLNGSFEDGTDGPTSGTGNNVVTKTGFNTDITGWTIPSHPTAAVTVDWVHTDYWAASDGSRSLDLNGSGPGAMYQSTPIVTVVGEVYLLEFDMAGNVYGPAETKSLIASVTDFDTPTIITSGAFTFDTTGKISSAMGWETKSLTFTATATSMVLGFASTTASEYGPAIDNVRVGLAPAVPEPGTLALAATLLLVFAGRAGRVVARRDLAG